MHGSADEVAAKWQRNISASVEDMKAGIARVKTAPGAAAAAARGRWVAAMTDTAVQDKWERGVRGVTLSQWQDAMLNKGVNRVAQGATAAQSKYTAALVPLLRHIDDGVNQIKSMDNSTFEARLQRSRAMQVWMHGYVKPSTGG